MLSLIVSPCFSVLLWYSAKQLANAFFMHYHSHGDGDPPGKVAGKAAYIIYHNHHIIASCYHLF